MALLKFMGSADVRVVYAGDTAGGQFPEGVPVDVQWDKTNRWVVDTSDERYSDVPQEWWDYLGEMPEIRDVTGYSRVPLNDHQKIHLGMREGDQPTKAELGRLDALAARGEVVAKIEALVQRDNEGSGLKKGELNEVAKEAGVDTKGTKEELFDRLLDFAESHRKEVAGVDLSQAVPVSGVSLDSPGTTVGGSGGDSTSV